MGPGKPLQVPDQPGDKDGSQEDLGREEGEARRGSGEVEEEVLVVVDGS
jgi:hypothetical protein